MASGRLFQVRGPAMANDLSPNEVCVRGTWSFPLSADLIPGRRSTLGWQNSARYYAEFGVVARGGSIGVGDGGREGSARAPLQKNRENIFRAIIM